MGRRGPTRASLPPPAEPFGAVGAVPFSKPCEASGSSSSTVSEVPDSGPRTIRRECVRRVPERSPSGWTGVVPVASCTAPGAALCGNAAEPRPGVKSISSQASTVDMPARISIGEETEGCGECPSSMARVGPPRVIRSPMTPVRTSEVSCLARNVNGRVSGVDRIRSASSPCLSEIVCGGGTATAGTAPAGPNPEAESWSDHATDSKSDDAIASMPSRAAMRLRSRLAATKRSNLPRRSARLFSTIRLVRVRNSGGRSRASRMTRIPTADSIASASERSEAPGGHGSRVGFCSAFAWIAVEVAITLVVATPRNGCGYVAGGPIGSRPRFAPHHRRSIT